MTCLECQAWVQRLLDGDAVVPPSLAEHLIGCHTCRELHASAQLLLKGLGHAKRSQHSFDLAPRLTALVLADRQARQWRARYRLLVTAGLAASILIMALAGYFFLPVPRTGQSQVAEKKDQPPNPDRRANESPRWGESVANARQAIASLSERWTARAREETQVLVGVASPTIAKFEEIPPVTENLEPAAQSLHQMGHGLTTTLEPVTVGARRAFAYLYHDLPSFEGKQ